MFDELNNLKFNTTFFRKKKPFLLLSVIQYERVRMKKKTMAKLKTEVRPKKVERKK